MAKVDFVSELQKVAQANGLAQPVWTSLGLSALRTPVVTIGLIVWYGTKTSAKFDDNKQDLAHLVLTGLTPDFINGNSEQLKHQSKGLVKPNVKWANPVILQLNGKFIIHSNNLTETYGCLEDANARLLQDPGDGQQPLKPRLNQVNATAERLKRDLDAKYEEELNRAIELSKQVEEAANVCRRGIVNCASRYCAPEVLLQRQEEMKQVTEPICEARKARGVYTRRKQRQYQNPEHSDMEWDDSSCERYRRHAGGTGTLRNLGFSVNADRLLETWHERFTKQLTTFTTDQLEKFLIEMVSELSAYPEIPFNYIHLLCSKYRQRVELEFNDL